MSKLFDFSSLAMIPSAYKDGKLYSVRPTDGDGDFTFSRGSNLAATRVDVNGLIEKGRENLLLQSNQFDTTWALSFAISVSGGQAGYDGSNDAWLLKRSDASARYIRQNVSSSGVHTFSVYAKPESVNWMYMYVSDGVTNYNAYFDLSSGTLGSTSGVIDSTIESVANGFYRCSISVNASIAAVRLYPGVANGSITGGVAPAGIYIQDAQLEAGLVATDYIETGASTAQAGILEDMPRLDYSGSCPALLLEPQRTNLITNSEYIEGISSANVVLTPNAAISPEGVQNAYQMDDNSTNSEHKIEQAISSTTGVHSVFVKSNGATYVQLVGVGTSWYQNFNIVDGTTESGNVLSADVEDYGNGWYRIWAYDGNANSKFQLNIVTAANSNRVQQYAGDGSRSLFVWGVQLEAGSYPTSYIPTMGASVTRSNDSGVLTALPDSLADNYTIFLELERMVPRLTNAVDMFSFYGSGSSRIRIMSHNPNYFRLRLYAADGSSSSSLYETSGDFAQGNNYKAAIVYSNGTFKCFANGSLFGTLDVVIDVNKSYLRTECISKQVLTFPTALTDSEAIALTTL